MGKPHKHRIIFILLALLVGCGGSETKPPPVTDARSSLQRTIDFLLSKQLGDGGWRSETYGQLRGGAANTALVVYALAHLPDDERKPIQPRIDRAIVFLLKGLDEQGFIRQSDGSADYPTYDTALLVTALHRMGMKDAHQPAIGRMVDYLKRSQQTARQGWAKDHPDFGGWNQTGGETPDAKIEGMTNIAITSVALEALHAAGALDEEVKVMAIGYVSRCQNLPGDGGFFFTTRTDHFLNKAGSYRDGNAVIARSYGTATADGIAALLAAGVAKDDPRVKAGLRWLGERTAIHAVPFEAVAGQVTPEETEFVRGLRFYYLLALARTRRALPGDALSVQRAKLREHLTKEQQPDGSWRNDNNMMREDDPLIASAMALAAMGMTED